MLIEEVKSKFIHIRMVNEMKSFEDFADKHSKVIYYDGYYYYDEYRLFF